MKALFRLALLFAVYLPVAFADANISATIVDSDGTPWVGGSYRVVLQNSQGGTATRIDNGQNVNPIVFGGAMDGTGSFSVTLTSSNNIRPVGSNWLVTICPNTTNGTCASLTILANASANISSQINPLLTAPRIGGGVNNQAYADVEVAAWPNNSYLNVTSNTLRCYTNVWAACGGGGGGGSGCTPGASGYLLLSTNTAGACANSLADYGVTSTNTFTFPASLTQSGTGATFDESSGFDVVAGGISMDSTAALNLTASANSSFAFSGNLSLSTNTGLSIAVSSGAIDMVSSGDTDIVAGGYISLNGTGIAASSSLCTDSSSRLTTSGCGTTTFQANGVALSSSSTINFENSSATNGLTLTFANPSAGNVQLGLSGILSNAGGGTGISTASSTGVPQVASGTWTVSTALPNPTTATTQTPGDNSTKIATDAFVLANAGIGTVTTFSTTGVSPLFTQSVATPTTTPAVTFTLSNAAANTSFGNFTGSSGAPSYTATTGTGSPVSAVSPALTGTPTVPTQTAGDNSTAAASDAFVQSAIANCTASAHGVINGISYTNCYTGSTFDVRVNAAMTDAEGLSNGNTTFIVDSTYEPASENCNAQITVGDGTHPVQWRVGAGLFCTTTLTSGTAYAVYQNPNSSIICIGNTPANRCSFVNFSSASNIAAMYSTNGAGYYRLTGMEFANTHGSTLVSGHVGIINGGYDSSIWDNDNWTDAPVSNPSDTAVVTVTGICCHANFTNDVFDSEYGDTALDIEIGALGVNGADFHNITANSHGASASGNPNILCHDTGPGSGSDIAFTGSTYLEGQSAAQTAPWIQDNGCRALSFQFLEADVKGGSGTTSPFIDVANTFDTTLNIGTVIAYAGSGTWTYPATIVKQHNTTADCASAPCNVAVTDSAGNSPGYNSRTTQFNNITVGGVVRGVLASEETVASSTTPTFSVSVRLSYNVLTANVTSFTLPAGTDGQEKILGFCQNGTGNFTVTPPANVHGFFTVGLTASKCSVQPFTYSASQTAWLSESPGTINQ